ncbi:MAG: DNA polymerase III subunit gamma/tau [Planctomycetaceae bacterium]|jgi:DNA polymerase-3 subunit gamma/tau|nr:DNA polymerase III subunit gamma/tau [Planctomycetaceae bacterium]
MNESHESIGQSTPAAYQVVARRYRPQDFGQLVGQTHVSQALSNAITTGKIGHAYLFTGARGVGKTSSARIFAKSLNCVNGPTPEPCNKCEICDSISTGEDVDVLEIDGASNRGIDEIRQLRQNASVRPSKSRFKIYIIDEVHMLTREAFNALLKTLEEPPPHVKFIFCTTEPNKIPITVLSRCQRFDFVGIDTTEIAKRLSEIASNEKVTADDGVFEMLARRAAGSMRDAQSLLEQLLSFAPEHIAIRNVNEMLGTADDSRLFNILQGIRETNTSLLFTEIDAAASEGVDFTVLIEQIMGLFRDLMVVVTGVNPNLLLYCDAQRYEELKVTAAQLGLQRVLASLQILEQTQFRMQRSTQSRILTELALVRMSYLGQLQNVAALIEQIRGGTFNIPAIATTSAVTGIAPTPVITNNVTDVKKNVPPQSVRTDNVVKNVVSADDVPVKKPQPPVVSSTKTPDLSTFDDNKAAEVWQQTVGSLNGMLADHAANFVSVNFRSPETFVVNFAPQMKMSFTYCQQQLPQLLASLQLFAGKSARLNCQLDSATASSSPQEKKVKPSQQRAMDIKDAAEKPIIKAATEMLGAQLVDVKNMSEDKEE